MTTCGSETHTTCLRSEWTRHLEGYQGWGNLG